MIRKALVSLVAFAILTTSSFAVTQNGLKAAFDEFNYSMTVDGAALNKDAGIAAIAKLGETIKALQAQGLTNQQLVDFAVSQIQDQKVAADVKASLAQMQLQKMTQEQSAELVKSMSSKFYAKGASWEGDATFVVVGVIVLVALVAAAVVGAGACKTSCGGGAYYGGGYYDYYYYDSYYYDYYWY